MGFDENTGYGVGREKKNMGYYNRLQNRKRSEATEQERVINWCRYNTNEHPELKLIYHIPNGGSRNQLEAANLKDRA